MAGTKTLVFLCRHGQPENPQGVMYGHLPGFGLSKLGFDQAEMLARFVSTRPISHLYSSPLLRARQTARVITRLHPETSFHVSRSLLEVRRPVES